MSDEKPSSLLSRALDAEERAHELARQVEDLKMRLRAALGADATTASRALSWIGRAEESERLLREMMLRIDQRSVDTRHFPPGWPERARSQLKAVDVLERDLNRLVEAPADDEYWTRFEDQDGRRSIVRQDFTPEERRSPTAN